MGAGARMLALLALISICGNCLEEVNFLSKNKKDKHKGTNSLLKAVFCVVGTSK